MVSREREARAPCPLWWCMLLLLLKSELQLIGLHVTLALILSAFFAQIDWKLLLQSKRYLLWNGWFSISNFYNLCQVGPWLFFNLGSCLLLTFPFLGLFNRFYPQLRMGETITSLEVKVAFYRPSIIIMSWLNGTMVLLILKLFIQFVAWIRDIFEGLPHFKGYCTFSRGKDSKIPSIRSFKNFF